MEDDDNVNQDLLNLISPDSIKKSKNENNLKSKFKIKKNEKIDKKKYNSIKKKITNDYKERKGRLNVEQNY